MRPGVAVAPILIAAVALLWWVRTSSSSDAGVTTERSGRAVRAPLPIETTRAPLPGAATPAAARQLFSARWGGADDELGRDRPSEGTPVGPMSFGVDGSGRVHVLDGVNGRIVRKTAAGAADGSFPIGVTHPEDIAVGADGTTAVLDRHRDASVALFDPTGKPIGELPLRGAGIADVGSVTAISIDGSDVYAERAHGPLVKLGSSTGTPASPRTEIPGRPSRDGLSFLNAGIVDSSAGRVYVASIDRQSETHRFTRELGLGAAVRAVVLLDTDRAGTIYFAAEVESETRLYCLDRRSGAPIGSATLPVNELPEESFRDLVVLDGGGVIHALRTERGVAYSVYRCS